MIHQNLQEWSSTDIVADRFDLIFVSPWQEMLQEKHNAYVVVKHFI